MLNTTFYSLQHSFVEKKLGGRRLIYTAGTCEFAAVFCIILKNQSQNKMQEAIVIIVAILVEK